MKTRTRIVHSQPSWRLASDAVEAYVTETGGHLGPVTFDRQNRKLQPYSVAPWVEEKLDPTLPPIIKVLRGDFFCMPFGGNAAPYHGEHHPVHGETANARWHLESLTKQGGRTYLHLSLQTKIRKGRVDKRITLIDGHNTVYCQHVVSGMSGLMNPGHHAMINFPDKPGTGIISTSRFIHGQVYYEKAELPENRGYSILRPGATFTRLDRVPMITGETTDLSRYPARRGFEDIATLVSDPNLPFAWIAVTFPKQRYVWFALKDPRVLRETVLWISNGGRHYAPWNGRHVNVMGIEDATTYFHGGLAESARPNPFTRRGFQTCLRLRPQQPLVVNYIMGIAPVPPGFGRVAGIHATRDGDGIVLRSRKRAFVKAPVDTKFLTTR